MIPKSDQDISTSKRIIDVWIHHRTEFLTNIFLLLVSGGGIIFTILEIFHAWEIWSSGVKEESWVDKGLEAFIGGMIGFLGLHFVTERFGTIWNIENNVENTEMALRKSNLISELENETDLYSLKDSTLSNLKKSLKNYVRLHQLIAESDGKNRGFEAAAQSELSEQNKFLELFSAGKIEFLNRDASEINKLLLGNYKTFDAVSYSDLEFWNSSNPENVAYYEACRKHFKDGDNDTRIIRVFIFEAYGEKGVFSDTIYKDEHGNDSSSLHTLVSVLEKHMAAKMAWAVAIKEEFDNPLTLSIDDYLNGIPDFALFDKGKAVSFFRTHDRDGRKFEIIFDLNVAGRKTKIQGIKNTYFDILTNCWFVNKPFADHYLRPVENYSAKQKIKNKLRKRLESISSSLTKEELNDICRREFTDKDLFPLIADSEKEIKEKANSLKTLLELYRKRQGAETS